MKLSQISTAGLTALTALAVTTPDLHAHNLAKYTAVPFVQPGYCSGPTAKWVNVNGKLSIQVTVDDQDAGFAIFNSVPTSGSLPGPATGTIPAGNYSFTISGLPSTGASFVQWSLPANTSPGTTIYNGTVTFTVAPGQNSFFGYIENPSSAITYYLSNFRQNNIPILADTTGAQTSTATHQYCGF